MRVSRCQGVKGVGANLVFALFVRCQGQKESDPQISQINADSKNVSVDVVVDG